MDRIYIFFMFIPIMAFHGFFQSLVAHWLGDDTAKDEGRLTLNPMSHIDWWGTLLMPALSLYLSPNNPGLVGWGQPVPVNPHNLESPRRDEFLIALAGPLSNLILAFLALLGGKLLVSLDPVFSHLVIKFAFTAVFLALFNCLPFPWLDGWIIVRNLFNVPSAFMEQTSIWWYLGLLLFLNFTPFQMVLIGWADSIVVRMGMLVGF